MAEINLEELSLKELRQLQKDVAKAIGSFEERQKSEARAKVEAVAKEMGFSLAELVGSEPKATPAPAPPKYRNPDDPKQTWSGRGRKPQWFIDATASGKVAEDMAIG